MTRYFKTACFVLLLLSVTILCLPLKSINILASDTDLIRVTVIDNAKSKQYKTGSQTVEMFFKEQGIQLDTKDQCDVDMRETVTPDMTIRIRRGIEVNVSIDGKEEKKKVMENTTVERLILLLQDEMNMAFLYEGDTERTVTENETLYFTSWRSELITESEAIPFETQIFETTALKKGVTNIRQSGVMGEQQTTIAVIYIGGVEQQREEVEKTIVSEPVAEIVDKGIGGTLGTTTDINSPSFQYIRKLIMNASAYTAGFESTGKNPGDPGYGITRSGLRVQPGIVSVDPNVIPLGTSLYVEGYGYSLAADTGGGIKGNMIDLYYESLEAALQFGRRNLTVYILE